MDSVVERIGELKLKRNAVILAHNYQRPEIQDIADFVGDSLDLSRKAAQTSADVIIFCGVHFMAETAAILSPQKMVLLPDIRSGCPMADMIDEKSLRKLKEKHPGAMVVCYVNTSAAVKAESDICCTSSNAVAVVNSISEEKIIFIPDRNLGDYVAKQTGKKLILFNGCCSVHVRIKKEDIVKARKNHPGAEVLVHPECTPDVVSLADKVLSTNGMIKYAHETLGKEMIIGTEEGIIYRLKKENPEKEFYRATDKALCENMKRITLEKVLWSLEDLKNRIVVPEAIRVRARVAIDKMLQH